MLFTKENAQFLLEEMQKETGTDFDVNSVSLFLQLVEKMDAFAKPRKAGSGRKDGLTKKRTVEILRAAVEAGKADAPRHYLERLVESGHLEKVNVATEKRGRPPVDYVVTNKGRSYVNLSRSWRL